MKRTKEQVSYNMSRIRGNGTTIEKKFAAALKRAKIKFRRQGKIIGKPDFVIWSKNIAVFCDSSFWHGYRRMKTKRHQFKSNRAFWVKKITRNIERDKEVNKTLKKLGWKVMRFWDFQIKNDLENCIRKIWKISKHPKAR